MAEFNSPIYCYGDLACISDLEVRGILIEIIDEVMVENRTYYDNDDREKAIEEIYSIIAAIVFNPNFPYIRGDAKAIVD